MAATNTTRTNDSINWHFDVRHDLTAQWMFLLCVCVCVVCIHPSSTHIFTHTWYSVKGPLDICCWFSSSERCNCFVLLALFSPICKTEYDRERYSDTYFEFEIVLLCMWLWVFLVWSHVGGFVLKNPSIFMFYQLCRCFCSPVLCCFCC